MARAQIEWASLDPPSVRGLNESTLIIFYELI